MRHSFLWSFIGLFVGHLVAEGQVVPTAEGPSAGIFSAVSSSEVTEEPTETFYQEIDIQRNPQFVVQGLNVAQHIHYQITSSFQVFAPNDKGNRKAIQTVESTTLLKADALSQAVFTKSLAEMKGQEYTYTMDEDGEITSVTGHQENMKAIEVQQPDSKGMMVSSVIDKDGWKELASLTLFQPPKKKSSKPFIRKTTHDWGALGSWYGQTSFQGRSNGKKLRRFKYEHKLKYSSPKKNAKKVASSLPFSIENAKFQVQKGQGEILYDSKNQHVTAVREFFHARGIVATSILGVASRITIDEKQIFTIKITGYEKREHEEVTIPSACKE